MSKVRSGRFINSVEVAKGFKPPQSIGQKMKNAMLSAGNNAIPVKDRKDSGVVCGSCGHTHKLGNICSFDKGLAWSGDHAIAGVEVEKGTGKFKGGGNPYHDPETGKFTTAGAGKHVPVQQPAGSGGKDEKKPEAVDVGSTTAVGKKKKPSDALQALSAEKPQAGGLKLEDFTGTKKPTEDATGGMGNATARSKMLQHIADKNAKVSPDAGLDGAKTDVTPAHKLGTQIEPTAKPNPPKPPPTPADAGKPRTPDGGVSGDFRGTNAGKASAKEKLSQTQEYDLKNNDIVNEVISPSQHPEWAHNAANEAFSAAQQDGTKSNKAVATEVYERVLQEAKANGMPHIEANRMAEAQAMWAHDKLNGVAPRDIDQGPPVEDIQGTPLGLDDNASTQVFPKDDGINVLPPNAAGQPPSGNQLPPQAGAFNVQKPNPDHMTPAPEGVGVEIAPSVQGMYQRGKAVGAGLGTAGATVDPTIGSAHEMLRPKDDFDSYYEKLNEWRAGRDSERQNQQNFRNDMQIATHGLRQRQQAFKEHKYNQAQAAKDPKGPGPKTQVFGRPVGNGSGNGPGNKPSAPGAGTPPASNSPPPIPDPNAEFGGKTFGDKPDKEALNAQKVDQHQQNFDEAHASGDFEAAKKAAGLMALKNQKNKAKNWHGEQSPNGNVDRAPKGGYSAGRSAQNQVHRAYDKAAKQGVPVKDIPAYIAQNHPDLHEHLGGQAPSSPAEKLRNSALPKAPAESAPTPVEKLKNIGSKTDLNVDPNADFGSKTLSDPHSKPAPEQSDKEWRKEVKGRKQEAADILNPKNVQDLEQKEPKGGPSHDNDDPKWNPPKEPYDLGLKPMGGKSDKSKLDKSISVLKSWKAKRNG